MGTSDRCGSVHVSAGNPSPASPPLERPPGNGGRPLPRAVEYAVVGRSAPPRPRVRGACGVRAPRLSRSRVPDPRAGVGTARWVRGDHLPGPAHPLDARRPHLLPVARGGPSGTWAGGGAHARARVRDPVEISNRLRRSVAVARANGRVQEVGTTFPPDRRKLGTDREGCARGATARETLNRAPHTTGSAGTALGLRGLGISGGS